MLVTELSVARCLTPFLYVVFENCSIVYLFSNCHVLCFFSRVTHRGKKLAGKDIKSSRGHVIVFSWKVLTFDLCCKSHVKEPKRDGDVPGRHHLVLNLNRTPTAWENSRELVCMLGNATVVWAIISNHSFPRTDRQSVPDDLGISGKMCMIWLMCTRLRDILSV